MAWFKCCDTLFSNRKVTKAWMTDPASLGAWLMCGTWSANQETDGHIPEHIVRMFGISDDQIEALVDAGLFLPDPVDTGWVMHDFLEYNPSRAELAEKRQKDAVRRASARTPRGQRAGAKRPVPEPVPEPVTPLRGVNGAHISEKAVRNRKRLGIEPTGGNAA